MQLKVYYSKWPKISTTTEILAATENSTVTVDLVGDVYTDEAIKLENWTIDTGTTQLVVKCITLKSNQKAEIKFEGIANTGTISVTALASAISE